MIKEENSYDIEKNKILNQVMLENFNDRDYILSFDSSVKKDTEISNVFRTSEDVTASNSNLKYVFFADKKSDTIIDLYDGKEFKQMFDTCVGENIQSHTFKIYCKNVFDIKDGFIYIKFSPDTDLEVQYLSEIGYIDFEKKDVKNGIVSLYKSSKQPSFKSVNGFFEIKFSSYSENKVFKTVQCSSEGNSILPDRLFRNDIEGNSDKFYPFSYKNLENDKFYISSKECFSKKGALINLECTIDFEKININENDVSHKLIMKSHEDRYIKLSKVVWEYFNGIGWAKLHGTYLKSDKNNTTISFVCPYDIEPVVVNAVENYYIRGRITEFGNNFNNNGHLLFPVMSNLSISYKYENFLDVERITSYNNGEEKRIDTYEEFKLFEYLENDEKEIYFGFDNAPEGDNIRFLLCMNENINYELPCLKWNYFSDNGWELLGIIDNTENFSHTGTITLMNNYNFKYQSFFGKSAYWIKVSDIYGGYNNKNISFPKIDEIHGNVAKVKKLNSEPVKRGQVFETDAENRAYSPLNIYRSSNRVQGIINKLVTVSDYECMAFKADNSILKAKCVPNRLPDGQKKYGNMLLAILTDKYNFYDSKIRIEKSISSKVSGNLQIIEPVKVYYDVKVEINTKTYKNIFEIKSGIEDRIRNFLDCEKGNFNGKGWGIGQLPDSIHIDNLLREMDIPVKYFTVMTYIKRNSEKCVIDLNNFEQRDFSVVFPNDIKVVVD